MRAGITQTFLPRDGDSSGAHRAFYLSTLATSLSVSFPKLLRGGRARKHCWFQSGMETPDGRHRGGRPRGGRRLQPGSGCLGTSRAPGFILLRPRGSHSVSLARAARRNVWIQSISSRAAPQLQQMQSFEEIVAFFFFFARVSKLCSHAASFPSTSCSCWEVTGQQAARLSSGRGVCCHCCHVFILTLQIFSLP